MRGNPATSFDRELPLMEESKERRVDTRREDAGQPLRVSPVAPPSEQPAQGSFDPGLISIEDFDFFYGSAQVLHKISLGMPERHVTALIGPSGCGKTTLLRSLNRMNDLIDGIHHQGDIKIRGESVYHPHLEVIGLRKRIGMVFQ